MKKEKIFANHISDEQLISIDKFSDFPSLIGVLVLSHCVHKRHLLFEKKVMTNVNSILKSRGITLLTKVHLIKDMYVCESWTKES